MSDERKPEKVDEEREDDLELQDEAADQVKGGQLIKQTEPSTFQK